MQTPAVHEPSLESSRFGIETRVQTPVNYSPFYPTSSEDINQFGKRRMKQNKRAPKKRKLTLKPKIPSPWMNFDYRFFGGKIFQFYRSIFFLIIFFRFLLL